MFVCDVRLNLGGLVINAHTVRMYFVGVGFLKSVDIASVGAAEGRPYSALLKQGSEK